MRTRKLVMGAVLIVSALVVSACTSPGNKQDQVGQGSPSSSGPTSVNVAWNQAFYSYNAATSTGNAVANADVLYLMNEGFNYYNPDLQLVKETSFGTYQKLSDNPLTVKYTIKDGVKWSDGTPVDAADMLLVWAAQSGQLNNVDPAKVKRDPTTGVPKPTGTGQVYFDSSSPGLALVKKTPQISDGGRSLTLVYSKPYADWEVNFSVGVPAHVTAMKALGISSPQAAKAALIKAVQTRDNAKLSKIANFWNTGFDFNELPSDKSLYLSDGPYLMTAFKKNQYLTLERNPAYQGEHTASIDKVTIRFIADPLAAVQALANGEVDLIAPQSTTDVLKAAQKIQGVTVKQTTDATYEHVDLTFNNGGPFDPQAYGGSAAKAQMVRLAFLKTIPRQQIVDQLIKPLNPSAQVRNSQTTSPGAPGYDQMVAANGSSAFSQVDIAGAKKLLAQAGVKTPVDVRFLYDKTNPRRVNEYQLIAQSAKQAGFNVIDKGNANWGELLGNGTYDATLFGWASSSTAVTESEANFVTNGQNNFGGYSNKTVDRLYKTLQTTTNPAKQLQLKIGIEKQLWKDGFGVTLFQFPGITAYNQNISNVQTLALVPTIFYGFWNWSAGSGG